MSDEQKKDAPQQPAEADTEAVNKAESSDSEKSESASAPAAAEQPAATSTEPSDPPAVERAAPTDEEKEAKAKAAAEARAARANARAKKTEGEEGPKEPSPLQPRLDHFVKLIKEAMSEDTVQEAFINEKDEHLPCVVIKNENWLETAQLLKRHSELKLNYLRNVTGVDYETHMEVVYHLLSLETKHEYCVKVKTDREAPSVPSATPVWPTADWNEREIYDLLGIEFPGHPDLRRIMMSDDWVGHPLRKDYEALDPEV